MSWVNIASNTDDLTNALQCECVVLSNFYGNFSLYILYNVYTLILRDTSLPFFAGGISVGLGGIFGWLGGIFG